MVGVASLKGNYVNYERTKKTAAFNCGDKLQKADASGFGQ